LVRDGGIKMEKFKKGQKLVCEPCGREVIVDACGASETTIWCCDRPMKLKAGKKK
jgi:hypothetical protein